MSTIRATLKPIAQVAEEFGLYFDGNNWKDPDETFFINNEMIPLFGSGKFYDFEEDRRGRYTHRCLYDTYMYHKDWFTLTYEQMEAIEKAKAKKTQIAMFDPEELL